MDVVYRAVGGAGGAGWPTCAGAVCCGWLALFVNLPGMTEKLNNMNKVAMTNTPTRNPSITPSPLSGFSLRST